MNATSKIFSNMTFRVLSLGGGGYLGLFTAQVLALLEARVGGKLRDHFDLICGTSIGGIIATGIAKGVPAEDIVRLFVDKGEIIFRKKLAYRVLPRKLVNAVTPVYRADGLRQALLEHLDETDTLECLYKDGQRRLSVSAVNLTRNRPHDFKTPFVAHIFRDKTLRLIDICLATSAAPTYFPTHKISIPQKDGTYQDELFCDGGVYANSPDLVGLFDATKHLNKKLYEVSMLSIGTPFSQIEGMKHRPMWDGYLRWVNEFDLPGLFIHLQETNSVFLLKRILEERYHRVNFKVKPGLKLEIDNTSEKNKAILLGMADHAFKELIESFKDQKMLD